MKDISAMQVKAKEAADLMKALSHESRLMILCLLSKGELPVSELMSYSNLSPSAFSQHLARLRQQKLVKTRKVSQMVYYSVADGHVIKVVKLLYKLYCQEQ